MTATTALTAQNTQGVQDIHVTPSAFVQKQIKACIDDIGVDVIKTGTQLELECFCSDTDRSCRYAGFGRHHQGGS